VEVCEVVVELVISGVEEKLAIRERPLSFVKLAWRRRRAFVVFRRTSWQPASVQHDVPYFV
jgi:hypothetical protein